MRRTHKRLLNFGPPTRHAKELLDKAASVSPVRREPELNVPIDSLEAARRLAEKAKSLDLLRQGIEVWNLMMRNTHVLYLSLALPVFEYGNNLVNVHQTVHLHQVDFLSP